MDEHPRNGTVPSAQRSLGKNARVWVAGAGDPILLLHGWGLGPAAYERSLSHLAERGFEVAAPTMAVVGKRWDIERAVHRARKTLDELGWQRATVVGNSLGGAVAISLAARHPERVHGLGLVNCLALPLERGFLGWVLPFRRYASAANFRALQTFGRNAFAVGGAVNLASAAMYARAAALDAELDEIRQQKLPAVVLWSEHDRLLPIEMGRKVARTLSAPLRVIPGADHDWPVRHPMLFARELELALRSTLRDIPS